MGFNMQKLMKQAQKMQADMAKELKDITVEGSAGGGMVKAVVNCRQELISLTIAPEIVDPEDVELLEDMVVAAVKEALALSQERSAQELQKITGGMNLPGF